MQIYIKATPETNQPAEKIENANVVQVD